MPYSDIRSTTWKFILRNATSALAPRSMIPYTDHICWSAIPQGRSGRFTILGYCQWRVPRSLYVLSNRVSRDAAWTPLSSNDQKTLMDIKNPYSPGARTYCSGAPVNRYRRQVSYLPFARASAPDLTSSYVDNSSYRRTLNHYAPRHQKRFIPSYKPNTQLQTQPRPPIQSVNSDFIPNPGYERYGSMTQNPNPFIPVVNPRSLNSPYATVNEEPKYNGPSLMTIRNQQRQWQRNRYLSSM